MEKSIELLKESIFEIKKLRRQNELMSARLQMFDSINNMLHVQMPNQNILCSPDIVLMVENYIDIQKENLL